MHNQKPLIGGDKNSKRAVILLHGRGGSAPEMLQFAEEYLPSAKFIALQADENTWYPYTFMMPREDNEPYLSEALNSINKIIKESDIPEEKISILGFSQGACLAAEYAAKNAGKYGAIIVLSGGLIGEEITPPKSSMQKTPIFFGCSENDPHIPLSRVEESINAFKEKDAIVTTHIYPGHSHTITDEEISLIRSLLEEI